MKKGFVIMCCIFFLLLCGCGSDEDVILQDEETDEADEAQTEDGVTEKKAGASENGTDAASGEEAESGTETGAQTPAAADALEAPSEICVYICGAVAAPGVYTLPSGGRVYELLEMAGGFAPDADERSANLAQPLEDGAMVYILTEEESAAGVDASSYTAAASTGNGSTGDAAGGAGESEEKVNINTADADALTALNGIGEAKAAAIVAYREEHGGFQSLEEIMEVSGIGEGTYDKIKDDIAL